MGKEFFAVNPKQYAQMRTIYCPQLFRDIQREMHLDNSSMILDIGAGTGQASQPFIELGCQVTLIEPAKLMSQFMADQYQDMDSVKVIPQVYEEVKPDGRYDLVISGTSFHWLDPEQKYQLAYQHLKDSGGLVLFWSRPDFTGNIQSKSIYALKDKYCELKMSNIEKETLIGHCRRQRAEINNSHFFTCMYSRLYHYDVEYGYAELCGWFDTFIDVIALHPREKVRFYKELKSQMEQFDQPLCVPYYLDLYICKKVDKFQI